jgi:hypothetical protein
MLLGMPAGPLDAAIRVVVLRLRGNRDRAPDDVVESRLRFKLCVQFY